MFVFLFILTALLSTLYSGQKSLILFIIATCVIVTVLLSALIIFQKRKSFKKCHAKKKVHFTLDNGFFSYFLFSCEWSLGSFNNPRNASWTLATFYF